MHTVGAPKERHTHVRYTDVVGEVRESLRTSFDRAVAAGLPPEAIVFDPGLDFAKQGADNLILLRELDALVALGRPLLLPVSRKSFIGRTLGRDNPVERDAGTAACVVAGAVRGAAIFRVHNVRMAWEVLRTVEALGAPCPGTINHRCRGRS
jgi:dihydropteroate synthase